MEGTSRQSEKLERRSYHRWLRAKEIALFSQAGRVWSGYVEGRGNVIPEDYQERVLEMYRHLAAAAMHSRG